MKDFSVVITTFKTINVPNGTIITDAYFELYDSNDAEDTAQADRDPDSWIVRSKTKAALTEAIKKIMTRGDWNANQDPVPATVDANANHCKLTIAYTEVSNMTTLFYATQPDVERGKAYISKPTKFPPRFIICHPDDLSELQATDITLIHIRDWKPAHPIEEPPTLSTTTTSDLVAMFEESLKELTA